jgi:predicted ABC-type ATPase
MSEIPIIVMFAGPNGSGKSTITLQIRQTPDFPPNYLNADEIAKVLPGDAMLNSYEAARMVEQQRLLWVNSQQSFAFETVMSHPSKLLQLQQAKMLGYRIQIYYVATNDPRHNIMRVVNRVKDNGHDVPANKIVERYNRSLNLLPLAIEIASSILLIDNTDLPVVIANGRNAEIIPIIESCPNWGLTAIAKVQQRQASRQMLQTSYNNGSRLTVADAWAGQYRGDIIMIDENYIVQAFENALILHDRLLLRGDFQLGQLLNIQYRQGIGTHSRE